MTVSSPNHPEADGGEIEVEQGDRIPGVPQHNLKADVTFAVTDALSLGANVLINSSQVFRGDEGNLIDQIPGYGIVNLRGRYTFWGNISVFAKVNNLFDDRYETFGLFGEADEVLGDAFEDARFCLRGHPALHGLDLRQFFKPSLPCFWGLPHFKPLREGCHGLRFATDDPFEIRVFPINCAGVIAVTEIADVNCPADHLACGVW